MPDYASVVVPILQEAGAELQKEFGSIESENKSDHPADLVTELDRKTETFIAEKLAAVFPDIDFFEEEHGGNRDAERFWLLDPIDGTAHFVRGIPYCTTMLVLIENGEPIFSAICHIASGDIYLAEKGKGATKNGEKISVSERNMQQSYVAHEVDTRHQANADFFAELRNDVVLTNTISAGHEFCLVAEGKLEARVTVDGFGDIYDFPQGALLVKEAGGIVKNLGSEGYDYTNFTFVAANPKFYEELQQKDYWQKRVEIEKEKHA